MEKTHAWKRQTQTIEGILCVFVEGERLWGDWSELENAIAKVDYDQLDYATRDRFIEFLCNACLRIWKREPRPLNQVEEIDGGFIINDYDWNAFLFAKQHLADEDLTTPSKICVDNTNVNTAEKKWLRSKCK